MGNKRRCLRPVTSQEYPTPLFMHHLSNSSLSSTYSWEDSVLSEASHGTSQHSPDSTSSLPPTPNMNTRSNICRPTDEAMKKIHHTTTTTTTIVDEDSSYGVYPPWTPDEYATVEAPPVSTVSQCQQQPQSRPVSGVAFFGSKYYHQENMSGPALLPDPQNGVHKEHYDFEFTKKDGSFFKLKEECCSQHPRTWSETIPVQSFANPKTGKVRQVCYFEDCSSSFKRPYDLFRHFVTVHGRLSIPCDYRKCGSGIEKAFNRLDHARDHYREYHKEDLVKRCQRDESKAEKADKWRERQPQRDSKNGLWWRCTSCLKRNPWNREMRKEEEWRCQEKDCHKECELERKIWRLEGVDAVLVFLKLVPGRPLITGKTHEIYSSKPLRGNRHKKEKKTKGENPLSPSALSTQDSQILPQSELCSSGSGRSSKRTDYFRSSSETMNSATNKKAAITPMSAAYAPTSSMITAEPTALERFPSYYHIATYEDAVLKTTTQTMQAQTPSIPNPRKRSKESVAMPEISWCPALFHPVIKGCDFCLSGWCLNDRVTACTSCNIDGCICETPPSQAFRVSPELSTNSQSPDEGERLPKRRKTVDDFRPAKQIDNMQGNMDSSLSLQAWNGASPIHPSLLSFLAMTPFEEQEQESSPSSPSYLWAGSSIHSSSENCSPMHSEFLDFRFGEAPLESDEDDLEDSLLLVSQFNDEWDAINYSNSLRF